MGVPNANINTTVKSTNMPLEPQNGELEGARDGVDHMLHARLSSSVLNQQRSHRVESQE